jgi:hypothetical protein
MQGPGNAIPSLGVSFPNAGANNGYRSQWNREYREIFLFVTGMAAGGFIAAVLFALAVTGGIIQFT